MSLVEAAQTWTSVSLLGRRRALSTTHSTRLASSFGVSDPSSIPGCVVLLRSRWTSSHPCHPQGGAVACALRKEVLNPGGLPVTDQGVAVPFYSLGFCSQPHYQGKH